MTGVEQVSLPTAVEQGSVGRKPSGKAAISERWKELRNGEQVAGVNVPTQWVCRLWPSLRVSDPNGNR